MGKDETKRLHNNAKENNVATKVCTKCGSEKNATLFYKDKQKQDGRRPSCIECDKKAKEQYEISRREKKAAYQREYAKSHKKQINAYQRERSKKNYDPHKRYQEYLRRKENARKEGAEWAKRNEDKMKNYRYRYYHANRTKCVNHVRKRQAIKKGATIGYVDYDAIILRDGFICHICGKEIHSNLQFDHVVPLSRGGAHSQENIKVAHKICNYRKGKRLMEELDSFHKRGV